MTLAEGSASTASSILDRIVSSSSPPPFALLHRPAANGPGVIDVLSGRVETVEDLASVPVRTRTDGSPDPGHDVLTLIPYRQIAERGFVCVDDGAPLLAMTIDAAGLAPLDDVLRRMPDEPIDLENARYDVDDELYAEIARAIIVNEIGAGAGANFVLKRSFVGTIADYDTRKALSFFRRLLSYEAGAYWTFIVHTGDRTFVGATPERHVSLSNGVATMNPISGTYRYPPSGPTPEGVLEFLDDSKETEELYMVVDEELKMLARVCENGGTIRGPHIRSMARLAHTEYFIEGHSKLEPGEILRETLFAPTITGSPLENACRVIKKYEPQGRGYYSGVIALVGRDAEGAFAMDSSILIRTADIDRSGEMRIGVGATLVRHSDPASEAAETKAKAAGLLAALHGNRPDRIVPPAPGVSGNGAAGNGAAAGGRTSAVPDFEAHPRVRAALERRNEPISAFWQTDAAARLRPEPELVGLRTVIVDAEDTFTSMIRHQLRSLGLSVTVRRFDEPFDFDSYELVVMGPGPGDPRDPTDPRIVALNVTIERLLADKRPFMAVCLSHQVLSLRLGLDVARRDKPNQGTQKTIDLFGTARDVGFYNSFAARSGDDLVEPAGIGPVAVSRDAATGEVHALRGPFFGSFQFHAESVLTKDGEAIFGTLVRSLLHETKTIRRSSQDDLSMTPV